MRVRFPRRLFLLLVLSAAIALAQTAEVRPGAKCLLARVKQLLPREDSGPQVVELLDAANAIFAETAPDDPAFAEALEWRVLFYRPIGPDKLQQWRANSAALVQRALEIRECRASIEPDELALALELQADVLGRTEAGAVYWRRAQEIRRTHVASVQPETQQSLPTLEQRPQRYEVPPTIAKKVEPEYSMAAKHAGLDCFGVVLALTIDPAGVPGEFRLQHGCGYGLDEKAVDAVKQWRFHPAMQEGKPVATSATVEVNFKLVP